MNKELQKITKEEYENLEWEANSFHCKIHNTFWYAGDRQAVYCKDCEDKDLDKKIDVLFEKFNKRIEKIIEKFEGRLTQRYTNIFESSVYVSSLPHPEEPEKFLPIPDKTTYYYKRKNIKWNCWNRKKN